MGSSLSTDLNFDQIFVHQKYNWDCGLACCAMVFLWSELRSENYLSLSESKVSIINSIYTPEFNNPLWSIDLFFLMHQMNHSQKNIEITMYTTAKGVQKHHLEIDWYQKHIDSDIDRVNMKFTIAEENSWKIYEIKMDLLSIVRKYHEFSDVVVVLLVDHRILNRESLISNSYLGHYILLVKYLPESDQFIYLDPNSSVGYASTELLENSRSVQGTDHDLILVHRTAS